MLDVKTSSNIEVNKVRSEPSVSLSWLSLLFLVKVIT